MAVLAFSASCERMKEPSELIFLTVFTPQATDLPVTCSSGFLLCEDLRMSFKLNLRLIGGRDASDTSLARCGSVTSFARWSHNHQNWARQPFYNVLYMSRLGPRRVAIVRPVLRARAYSRILLLAQYTRSHVHSCGNNESNASSCATSRSASLRAARRYHRL